MRFKNLYINRSSKNHVWNFSMVGGVKRVNLESGNDLLNLQNLDPKLWTALSCPINDLEIDHKTLAIIDEDKDGQIRVPEIIEAVNWVCSVIKNPNDLVKQEAIFPLSAINDENELGRKLLASAKIILKNLGKSDATSLTVEETSDFASIFTATSFNGDGIITEESVEAPSLKKLIGEILSTVGSIVDRNGKEGINEELISTFYLACESYASWMRKKEQNADRILIFGAETEKAFSLFTSIKSKVDDYFLRCKMAAFDNASTSALNLQVAQVEAISAGNLTASIAEISNYPLAKIEANKALSLTDGINPAWEKQISEFKVLVNAKNNLTEHDWQVLSQEFKDYSAWLGEKEGAVVEALGYERIKEILATKEKEQLLSVISKDLALKDETDHIILVDKLVRYHRDIFHLLNNFVTFRDFYTRGSKAIFQAGTLYIDQRSCDLCIKVNNMPKHNAVASFSGLFLIYCECVQRSSGEKMIIAAALTNGDIDNVVEGKNALFYDRNGDDWDATVIKIIDKPISIRQAFFSPYRKVSRFIEKQVNKAAASQDEKANANLTKGVEAVPGKIEEHKVKKEAPAPFDIGKFVGIFAAIGMALGAIGTVIASVVTGFLGLTWWKMPIAFAGILLLISGPSMIMAFLTLRKRNLALLLDANGWAINSRAVINIPFGNTLTHLAELPEGAKLNLIDPFTQKKKPLWPIVLIVLALAAALVYLMVKFDFMEL